MKTMKRKERGEKKGSEGGKNESRDPRYDIVLMLSQPVVIEM